MSPFFKFQKCSRANRNEEKPCAKIKIGNKSKLFIKILIIIFLVGSVFLYLLQINSLATKGFKIQALEMQMSELNESNKKLNLEAVRLRSMAELNEKVQNLDMVPINNFSYIDATSTGMAKK